MMSASAKVEERSRDARSRHSNRRRRSRSRSPRERVHKRRHSFEDKQTHKQHLKEESFRHQRQSDPSPPRGSSDTDAREHRTRRRERDGGRERGKSREEGRLQRGERREERGGKEAGGWREERGGRREEREGRERGGRREEREGRERQPRREEVKESGQGRMQTDTSTNRPRQRISEEHGASEFEFGRDMVATQGSEGSGDRGWGSDDKAEPDFVVSGKLAAETNTYKGVVLNYSEPEEARIPKKRWRLYGFKGEETLPTFFVHRQSAYLMGRDRRVCDMAVNHPSCSKQHAVLQYRLVEYAKPDGSTGKRVRPYLIDLDSTNGSYINNQRIESARYYELKEKDMIKFGFSSREYVILHENSKTEEPEDEERQN